MPKKKSPHSGGVNRRSMQLTIEKLMKDHIHRIDIDADYQREKVWTRKQQEDLLDSIVKGIDIPKLYLAEVRGNKNYDYECIDGKQRLLTLSAFFSPEAGDSSPLKIEILNQRYTHAELDTEHHSIAKAIGRYTLDFVVYDEANLTDSFIVEIFKRLQLGVRLNSGEILNAHLGTIRDFVFKEIGKEGAFVRNTNLSNRRFSRQFTLAQICINSFHRHRHGEFVRARLADIEDFFSEESSLDKHDENLKRIRKVLQLMDVGFGQQASYISSRAIAVSAYLFCESLYVEQKTGLIRDFARFYVRLLTDIEEDMTRVSRFKRPKSPKTLNDFQKYVLQASVEPYAITRRDKFLRAAFKRVKKQ